MRIQAARTLVATSLICLSAAFVLVATVGSIDVRAQAAPTLKCATLLTEEELTKVIGEKMTDMGAQAREAGETECPWILRGGSSGFKTVSVQFYDLSLIKASPNASTPDKFFEMLIVAAEDTASGKREMLPGIGVKAAFLAVTPQVLAVVQRPDGVARIVGNNLTKAQMTAVARAVATP